MPDKTSAARADSLEKRLPQGQPLDGCYYDSIRAAARQLDFSDGSLPGIGALNQLAQRNPHPVVNANGHAIRFAAQNIDPAALSYEAQIFASGIVPTRANNIHDLFNALVWLSFPHTKAALNARHMAAGSATTGSGNRGPAQDALTLFDECGVVVISDQPELLQLISAFQWKELFWKRREAVKQHMRFFVFGHGLMEQLLNPYVGLTGKAVLMDIQTAWLAASGPRPAASLGLPSTSALLQHIDARSPALVLGSPRLAAGLGPLAASHAV